VMENKKGRDGECDAGTLRELCSLAVKRGAEEAVIISATDVIVDPRVRFKCMIAPCYESGICANCPPYGYATEDVRSMISAYERAVFFRVAADEKAVASPSVARGLEEAVLDDEGACVMVGAYYMLCYQIVALIERRARQLGHEPLGFTAGDCKEVLCFFHAACRAIRDKSKCRHPDLSRPSMEASGMDVYTMAANVGWEMYPIGASCRPGDVPRASICGIVLVC
jgi:predicted metal-binding protein